MAKGKKDKPTKQKAPQGAKPRLADRLLTLVAVLFAVSLAVPHLLG